MYYCIYTSSASKPLPDSELMNIKEQSKTISEKSGVTGLLIFHRNNFIHYYEGDKKAVTEMQSSIKKDKRLKDVKVLSEGNLNQQQFPNWSMDLRVLDKDPLFSASELAADSEGIKKMINDRFMSIV